MWWKGRHGKHEEHKIKKFDWQVLIIILQKRGEVVDWESCAILARIVIFKYKKMKTSLITNSQISEFRFLFAFKMKSPWMVYKINRLSFIKFQIEFFSKWINKIFHLQEFINNESSLIKASHFLI